MAGSLEILQGGRPGERAVTTGDKKPRFLAAGENKREGRENRPRSRHCERWALRVCLAGAMPGGATALSSERSGRGGKVKQGCHCAASQETCLGV